MLSQFKVEALYFETYIPEYVSLYDKLPISAFVWKKDYEGEVPLTGLSYGIVLVMILQLLKNKCYQAIKCKYLSPIRNGIRWYMFTIDNANSTNLERNVTYSEVPSVNISHFNILKLENGYFAAQPNNRVIFYDKSYTPAS